jgi:lactoylglutathione lyase
MIKFAYTIFYVSDVTETISFYEKAFGFERKFIAETNDYGELETGHTTLSFASTELAKKNLSEGFIESDAKNKPFAMEIGFTSDDVEKTMDQAIKAGAILVENAKTKPWGQIVGYLKDMNGFLIEICTPMA